MRRQKMLEVIRSQSTVSVEDLAATLDVSKMTVHRDLDALSQQRLVRKVRGGATMQPSVLFEADFAQRGQLNRREKQALAAAAAEFIEPGMAIALDDSTTVASIVPLLREKRPLTVLTNSLALMVELGGVEEITVISVGGTYDRTAHAFFGRVTEDAIASLWIDLVIMSASAVRNCTTYYFNADIARTKQAFLDIADRKVAIIDSSKFRKSGLHKFVHLSAFDQVLVAGELPGETARLLREEGVAYRQVDASTEDPSNSGANSS